MDKSSIILGVELFHTKSAGIEQLSEAVKELGAQAYLTNEDEHSQIVIAPFTSEVATAVDDLIEELGGFGESESETSAAFKPVVFNIDDKQSYNCPELMKAYQESFDDAEINNDGTVALVEINDTFVDYVLDNQQTIENEINRVINKFYLYLTKPKPAKLAAESATEKKADEPVPAASEAAKQVTLPDGSKFQIDADSLFPQSQAGVTKRTVGANQTTSSDKPGQSVVDVADDADTTPADSEPDDESLEKQSKSLEVATTRFNDLANYQAPSFETLALRELQPDVVEAEQHIADFRREAIYSIAVKLNQLRVEAKKNTETPVAKSKADTQKNQKVIDDNLKSRLQKLKDQKQQAYVKDRNKYVESLRPALENAYDEKNREAHIQAVAAAEHELEANAARHKQRLKADHENYAKSAYEKADETAIANLTNDFVQTVIDKFDKQVAKVYGELQDKAMSFQGNVDLATAEDKGLIEQLQKKIKAKDADLAAYRSKEQTVHDATSELQTQIQDLQKANDQLSESLTQRNQEVAAERQNVVELIRNGSVVNNQPLQMAASTNAVTAQPPQSAQPTDVNRTRSRSWGWLIGLGSAIAGVVMVVVVGFSLYHVGASKADVASVKTEAAANSLSASYALASSKQAYESSVSYAARQSSEAAASSTKASSAKATSSENIKKGDKFNYRTEDGKMVQATADSDHSGTYEVNGKTIHFTFSQSKD